MVRVGQRYRLVSYGGDPEPEPNLFKIERRGSKVAIVPLFTAYGDTWGGWHTSMSDTISDELWASLTGPLAIFELERNGSKVTAHGYFSASSFVFELVEAKVLW